MLTQMYCTFRGSGAYIHTRRPIVMTGGLSVFEVGEIKIHCYITHLYMLHLAWICEMMCFLYPLREKSTSVVCIVYVFPFWVCHSSPQCFLYGEYL